ncbi:unnamed protein product [Diatraea saccharalis]|uniref:Uncharacterized protein n=1 Tax=Diatraea saccharalis TaxID=40085 RepID=A0A9N9R469_9NEOP|nr:unnamed protein product [Diatraea saccharalis]
MHISTSFKQTSTYLALYRSQFRSQLEYAVPIWNPFYNKYIETLENVQKKLLQVMHYRCYICYALQIHCYLSYDQLSKKYNIIDLSQRRTLLQMKMLYDLCHNK